MANRFISILDNIGHLFKTGIVKALAVEQKLIPLETAVAQQITVFDPPVGAGIMAIITAIGKVEQVATAVGASAGTGTQKLQAALPDVEQVILGLPIFQGKHIPDVTRYNSAIIGITSAFADLLNAFETDVPINPNPNPALPPHPLVVTQVGKA